MGRRDEDDEACCLSSTYKAGLLDQLLYVFNAHFSQHYSYYIELGGRLDHCVSGNL